MELQLALDLLTPDQALELAGAAAPWFDLLEVGTPMVMAYGMEPVRLLRRAFPHKAILADLKIIDSSRAETRCALQAGADWVTVLAVAGDLTVRRTVEAARELGGRVMADLTAHPQPARRAQELIELGVDRVCVHTARDLVDQGADPWEELEQVAALVAPRYLAVAGGISPQTVGRAARLGVGAAVVGGAVTRSPDPAAAAALLWTAAGKGAEG